MKLPDPPEQRFEQRPGLLGGRSSLESGTIALRRIGRERELRDNQYISVDLAHIQVHFSVIIWKNAICEQAIGQTVGTGQGVAGFDTDEGQDAATDGADRAAIDVDPCLRNALKEGDQAGAAVRGVEGVEACSRLAFSPAQT